MTFLGRVLILTVAPLATAAVATAQTTPIYSYSVPAAGGYAPNGNLMKYVDSVNGTWTMQYDSLNRLGTANATAGPYQSLSSQMNYDNFGNRTNQTLSGSPSATVPQSSWVQYDGTNQATASNMSVAPGSITYDAAGNNTYDGANQYLYDAEGRVCAVFSALNGGVTQYFYDADGHRVAKASSGAFSCSMGGPGTTPSATYILGPSGEQMTELDQTGNWKHTNIFADGQLLATYDPSGLHFPLSDPLGTKRVQASSTGSVELSCTSLPYGDGLSCTGSGQDATEHHFTGKERDTESGNDYFGARYYGSSMGRFTSADDGSDQDHRIRKAGISTAMCVTIL